MGYFDKHRDVVPETIYDLERQGEGFVEERGATFDVLHNLFAGTGDAITILGNATGSDSLKALGSGMLESSFGKPDAAQYYGTDGRVGRIVDGIARSLPTSLAIGGTAAAGGMLGGIPGAIGGYGVAMGAFGKGTYELQLADIQREQPDMPLEKQQDTAMVLANWEVFSEIGGQAVPFVVGGAIVRGLSKGATKNLGKAILVSGSITPKEAINSVVKQIGAKEVIKGLVGGDIAGGMSEVVNELGQASTRDLAGLEPRKVDLIDTYFIGSGMGSVAAGAGMAMSIRDQQLKRKSLETALASEDQQTRVNAVDTIARGLDNIDPEIGSKFHIALLPKALEGPVDLVDVANLEAKEETTAIVEKEIIENPEAIMEEKGIPLGTAEEADRAEIERLPEVYEETRILDEGIPEEDIDLATRVKDYMNVSIAEAPLKGTAEYDAFIQENDKLTTALQLDDNRSKAIKAGMEKVLLDTNKLAEITDLDEREVLTKRIEKTKGQITKEIATVTPKVVAPKKPKVAAEKPVVPKAVPTVPEVGKAPIVVTEEVIIKEANKIRKAQGRTLISKDDKPTRIKGETDTAFRDRLVAEVVPVKPVAPKKAPVAPKAKKPVEVAPEAPKAVVAPKVEAVKPIKPEAPKPIEGLKRKTYEEQLLVTKGLEDRLAKAQAQKGTPEKVAEAKDLVKELGPQAIAARKHLQTLKKPVVKEVFKSKKEAEEAGEQPKMSQKQVEKAQAVQDLGVSISPETQMLLTKHKGTAKEFVKSLETPQQTKAVGVGKGRTISFHEGTTLEYQGDKEKASKRWLIRQGALTKRVASEPMARKAIAEGTVAKLKDFEDKGKVAADVRAQEPMSPKAKKEVDKFYKENDPKDFGAPSDVALATSVLAKAGKLYDTNGMLEKDLLKKAVKSAKNVMEGKSTESKQAAKAGIVSGTTEQIELSTEEAILIPVAKAVAPKAEVAPVVTIEAGEALKAEYLARHKENMKKTQKMTQAEFIGKAKAEPKEAKAVLDSPVAILKDEALYADPDVISWRKNVEPSMTEEQLEAIDNDWMEPNDYNPLLAFQAFDKQYPGIPVDTDLANVKMQLRSYVFQEGRVMQNFFSNSYKNASELLDGVIAQGSKEEAALASFIKKSPKIDKLLSIPVLGTNGSSFFTSREGGKILMSSSAMLKPSIWLHEIQHAATSQEIVSNEKMAEEVQVMMRNLKNASGLDRMQLKAVDAAGGDASKFNDIATAYSVWTDDQLQVAYALVNEREFLAQAYSSKYVRDLMRTTRHTGFDGIKTSIWQRIKDFFTEIMQLPKGYDSVLEAALRTSGRLYRTSAITGIETQDFALEDRRKETLDEATRKVLEERKETNRYKEKAWEKGGQALSTFKKLAEPISDTLLRISKPLHAKLMSMEARQMLKGTEYRDGITPFLKYYKGMTDSQKTRLDIGLLNNNKLVWDEMPKDVRESLETVLGDASDRSIDVGLLTEKKKLYFPRRVKDIQGLSDYLMRGLDEKGPLGMALQKKATELGMEIKDLPQPVRNQVVTDMLSSGEIMQLPRPGSTKQRTIGKVTSDLVPFYETSSSALLAHIYEVNDKVSLREFVGGSARKAKVRALMNLNTKIDKETDATKKALLMNQWKADATALQDLELDLDEGIQALIDKELSSKSAAEQTEVLSLLSARMRQRGASGIADTARNVGYMATMGNFLSAITQFGDIPIVFYRYGINMDTISSIGEAFKAVGSIAKGEITGKTAVTDAFVGSMDFTNALREFTSGDNISGKALDVVFKYSGLKYADLVGKEAAMRASFKFYQNPKNKKKFMDKFENFFEKPEDVLRKIQMGNRKDADVLTALFAELSDFQPISLSQQSEVYLGAGNMRMFYALKTFTLRTTSAAIREGMMDMKKGDKKSIAKGTAKIASIIMIYALAGAGADELKDLLRGKTSSVTDNTADNVLQMFFLSKYTLEKGMQKDQVLQGIISNLLPPVRYADNFIADVAGLVSEDKEFKFKSLAVVPVIGTLIQARTSPQQASYSSQERTAILEDVKANKKRRRGARDGGITDRVREYNKKVKDKDLKISDSTIMSAYRR